MSETKSMKQPATKLSIVGVLLAILAAVFYPSKDGPKDGGDPGKGQEVARSEAPVTPPAGAPKAPAEPAKATERETPKSSGTATEREPKTEPAATTPAPAPRAASAELGGLPPSTSRVGFTSRRSWQSHFEKHGHEFGRIDADQYLERAKALRDAPPSADILEHRREADGVFCRFHKPSGGFIAYHEDKTIRTYFRPNDGEAYYRRQLDRRPGGGR